MLVGLCHTLLYQAAAHLDRCQQKSSGQQWLDHITCGADRPLAPRTDQGLHSQLQYTAACSRSTP